MEYKKILGLDLGTNSIGAALINLPKSIEDFGKEGNIEWAGSRILPMDKFIKTKGGESKNPLGDFSSGIGISKAAARRQKRSSRRLKHRYKLRRTRLVQVFKTLGWMNENFPEDFKKRIKDDENFKFHIGDFLPFEKSTIEEATKLLGAANKNGEIKLPEDWIIYYLRKKALTEKISIAELCRIIYMMNQRRGFKSSRKDLKEGNVEEIKWVEKLKVKSVEQETFELNKNKNYKFKITVYNDKIKPWLVERKKKPDWEEKEFTFLITDKTEIKKDGTKIIKQNNPQIPKEDDWELCITALDNQIGNEYPGTYFFNGLINSVKNKTDFKIRQYAVYRKKYKQELEAIWNKQMELNTELKRQNTDEITLRKLAERLYSTQTKANKPKLTEILNNTLLHLISDDIIYYQRDLKSQKQSRSECQYEKTKGIDGEMYGVKSAPKSSPEFQEFRIWQDIHNIKVLLRNMTDEKGYEKINVDITSDVIDDKVKEQLFILFDTNKEISQQDIFELINWLKPEANLKNETHKINMFFNEEKRLDGNKTKDYFRKLFKKCDFDGESILSDKDKLYRLWNISYSISLNDEEISKQAIKKALKERITGKSKNIFFNFPENVINEIANAPEIESSKKYASYSSKAIRKLLPLMRCGIYHIASAERINILYKNLANETDERKKEKINIEIKQISETTQRAKEIYERLQDIDFKEKRINDVADDDVQKQLLKSFITKKADLLNTKGLNTYQACYLIYDRHSERIDRTKYTEPSQFNIMELLPNNSLRNPVVEQVIREALFLVKDIWGKYGQPDEIHIEMGRELKKNAEQRKRAAESSTKNFEEKKKIKAILTELLNGSFEQYENKDNDDLQNTKTVSANFEVKPNPNNPLDIDRFKLWKQSSGLRDEEFEKKAKEEKIPKSSEVKKYVLWLSQKCVSPYSGKIIPLSKLFDGNQYDFEHILPKSKVKMDGLENLIICEKGINKAKGGELAAVFIKNRNGGCEHHGKHYTLFNYDAYINHCKNTFRGKKLQNLLASEVPDDFIERQINDTRYITRKISELLYPVAKDKNTGIVFTIGAITTDLKREWGLQKEWKQLIRPRFERLGRINNTLYIKQNDKDKNDIDFNIPENQDLDTKRIDHRHHTLDAIIIAATTREHIRYINSLKAADTDEEFKKVRLTLVKRKIREWQLPWESFTRDAKEKLEQIIVTFKSNNKVFDKPVNKYFKWKLKEGRWEKSLEKQVPNKKWLSVRQSLFAEQPHGKVYIKEIVEKKFETPKQMLEIFKVQLNKEKAQNTSLQSTSSYIYDKETRQIIKQKLKELKEDDDVIIKELKKFKPINSKGERIITVRIAEFHPYAAKRKAISKDFDHKVINKIPYAEKSRIPIALHNHLLEYEQKKLNIEKLAWRNQRLEQLINEIKYEPVLINEERKKLIKEAQSEAFSEEGLEALDKNVGMKIRMVTLMEDVGIKNQLKNKLAESDSNPYFLMHENIITKERTGFTTLSSYHVVQRKIKESPIASKEKGYRLIVLRPYDLVYMPDVNDDGKIIEDLNKINWVNPTKEIVKKIYLVKSFSKYQIFFVPAFVSSPLDKNCNELDNNNKTETAWTNGGWATIKDKKSKDGKNKALIIKEYCIKLNVDRLGNIRPFNSATSAYKTSNLSDNIVSEPSAPYLQTFISHEEANEADAKAKAGISPEQHLANTTERIKSMYADELKTPMDKTLKFRND